MTLNLQLPEKNVLKPRITVFGVGGAGGNAVNNMIASNLQGVEFVVANTDAQALECSLAENRLQLGEIVTKGLGAGSLPEVGKEAAEEAENLIREHLDGANMIFITAGMGGGTGTGAAPVIAKMAKESGILTVGVVTKPFYFEGARRMRTAESGLSMLQQFVDTLIVIPNQNLFRIANENTTFADAFKLADNVLHSGVRGVTDLMIMPGLINLDFADIRTVMREMGKAMMGTGEAEGERRAIQAAEAAISNPLLDNVSMKGARGVLISITGGADLTLFEVDEAANRIREEVDTDANIIFGSTFNESLEGKIRVSVVATGIDAVNYIASTTQASYKATPANDTPPIEPAATAPTYPPQAATSLHEGKPTESTPPAASHLDTPLVPPSSPGEAESGINEEYLSVIKKLNEEYESTKNALKEEWEKSTDEGQFFIAPPPSTPESLEQDVAPLHQEISSQSPAPSRKKASVPTAKPAPASGGFFSRVAKVFSPNATDMPKSPSYNKNVPPHQGPVIVSSKGASSRPGKKDNAAPQDDILDIPAFLRRKA